MKVEEREKLAKESGEIARAETLKHCKAVKLTPRRALKRIAEGLDAHEVKPHYDKDRGRWAYSKSLVAHGTRLKAAEMVISLLDMKPAERKKIEGELKHTHELSPELEELFKEIEK